MKVVLLNGSPRKNGCTFTALGQVAVGLEEYGVETEVFQMGPAPIRGCTSCGRCKRERLGQCVFDDDRVNECLAACKEADGLVVGSPVYYAGPNGMLCALLDRMFYAGGASFAHKPGTAVVSCRRGGSTASLDRLNKYFTISNMPLVSSSYWNMVHGNTPEEVMRDEEGVQVMRNLGRNMGWLLQSIHKAGLPPPEAEKPRAFTNFIR